MLIYDVMIQQSTEIHILGLKKKNNNNRKNNENFVKILGFNFYESLIPFSSSFTGNGSFVHDRWLFQLVEGLFLYSK